jgi:hypothetical protein
MRNLEIIHLRSTGSPMERICKEIESAVGDEKGVRIFRRDGLETDICVHILHSSELTIMPSQLGCRLASALKDYGLVEQTYWQALR